MKGSVGKETGYKQRVKKQAKEAWQTLRRWVTQKGSRLEHEWGWQDDAVENCHEQMEIGF